MNNQPGGIPQDGKGPVMVQQTITLQPDPEFVRFLNEFKLDIPEHKIGVLLASSNPSGEPRLNQ